MSNWGKVQAAHYDIAVNRDQYETDTADEI